MAKQTYYVLKVKGKAKIPDYIQVRDSSFTLIGYFRPGRAGASRKDPNRALFQHIEAVAEEFEFGVITRCDIEEPLPAVEE